MSEPPNRIRWFRESEDLSLRALSVRIDPSGNGPDTRTINRWETGENGVPDYRKRDLARVFGVSIAFLMGWDDQPQRPHERERVTA